MITVESGAAITQQEFEALKAKILAGP